MNKPAGVILAGGRSSRMGGRLKASIELDDQPLIEHVIQRLREHTQPLLLNCQNDTSQMEDFGLQRVPDLLPGYRGPLMGLYSVLQYLSEQGHEGGLILCPCDAPFVPHDLVEVLLETGGDQPETVVVVSYQGVLQPTFSLWHGHHLPEVRDTVINQGRGGLKHLIRSLPHRVVDWEVSEPSPFFNVNTPQDLDIAGQWLDRRPA